MSLNEASSFERVVPQVQLHRNDRSSLRRQISLAVAGVMICLTLPLLLSGSGNYKHRSNELLSWSNSFDDGTGILSGQQHGVTRTIVSCDADDPSCSFIVSPEDYAHGKWVSTKGEPSHEKYVQIRKDRLQPSSYEDDIDLGPAAGISRSDVNGNFIKWKGLRNVKSGADFQRVRVPDRDSDYADKSYDDVVGLRKEWRERWNPSNYRREQEWERTENQRREPVHSRSTWGRSRKWKGDRLEDEEEEKLRRDLDSLKRNREKEKPHVPPSYAPRRREDENEQDGAIQDDEHKEDEGGDKSAASVAVEKEDKNEAENGDNKDEDEDKKEEDEENKEGGKKKNKEGGKKKNKEGGKKENKEGGNRQDEEHRHEGDERGDEEEKGSGKDDESKREDDNTEKEGSGGGGLEMKEDGNAGESPTPLLPGATSTPEP
ncbi:hypothetical protein GUITHDRAFT_103248 [Guillardia theta CCMP2712]|uniref:Uncharacterized protein n=1 Tax=Guillardia theta (strain CCMP2712) TaxID=905079 RepID=L1JSC4_GUITC|nr:hypothetical protein GUITHDRAFT_103248 [Guillardia theta CCMP2712]EKX51332.1 hypothetical protein GUITHDRAFT_103248 [Guillardia theta CCMP2712]|eukprot:XP_005838312.1 hypothetical protein GUITHDRAFT_103248 [Guillardia theta CCMP2712]